MRSIWKGSISFGLVSIPVKVFGATENHSVSFRQVHAADGGRIRYRKVCELDEEEVPTEEITKAFEAADGTTVPLSDEDLSALPLPTARTIEILAFVPADTVDPLQLDRSYYLGADGGGAVKPYVLLREALNRSEKVAIAKLALRGRETLAMLRVVDDALALHTMLWPDEIRPATGVAPDTEVGIRDAELDLADTLMETLGDLDPEELHDEYREAVEALVAAKLEGVEPEEARERVEAGGKVIDLMAALENSVRAAREGRGEQGAAAGGEGGGGGGKGGGAAGAKEGGGAEGGVRELRSGKGAGKGAGKAAAGKTAARKSTAKRGGAEEEGAGKAGKKSGGSRKSTAAKKSGSAAKESGGRRSTSGAAKKTASAGKRDRATG
ncbi:Ku protein [Streptomyces sp. S07_1.15]|uniref:non-homologous end joining protein Ku n=1 Tax=Streptomyces sp. S07_1.15 TaxID=2873925 RepID=UPI001D14947F|nr:Ku protein [Streptomyces sp. S07_1.15]MCC3654358.1 Ku protein [Streptomyces sp. S07_1.15]